MKKLFLILLTCILLTTVIGCSNNSNKKVVIASKPMTEQYIIAEILTQLIEGETDIKVEQKLGIGGGTSNIHPAMEKGEIDMYPEYSGTGWLFVLKQDLINDPQELYEAVKQEYLKEYQIKWLELYGFNDTYALVINKDIADKYNINTYSDLAKYSKDLVFGAEYDFYERDDGYEGLKSVYNLDFDKKVELDIGLKYDAINSNKVDVINAFSTDAKLENSNLKVLIDDKNFFPSYFATTLVREETLEKYSELEGLLNKLAGTISNEKMIEMNYEVEIEKKDPKVVAKEFLQEQGLLK
jgi:glycine betaine/choline ABC-type transport system substrate-binding protein